jgi:hypothetical protein
MSESMKQSWLPSMANGLKARNTLIRLIRDADEQRSLLAELGSALEKLAKARGDESIQHLARCINMELGELYGILISADAATDTGVIVERGDE